MTQRIDAEIERMVHLGHTPTEIEVGEDVYEELHEEQNPTLIAPLVGPGEMTPLYTDREVKDYKGIRVLKVENVAKDYLNILF